MARPRKKGIDYFPLDVDFLQDESIRILKVRYGADGVMIYIYLLCRIYREGYYIPWTDDTEYIVADDLSMSHEKVRQVLKFLLERSLLDNTLFQSDTIITSAGIQRRYQEAVKSRTSKTPIIVDKYWILDESETAAWLKVSLDADNSTNNDSFSENNSSCSKEEVHKVKKSKGEESKGYSASNNTKIDAMFEAFWASYPNHRNAYGARSEFVQLDPGEALFKEMMASLEKQKRSDQWTKDGGQFVPQAENWIRKQLWKDELPVGKGRAGIAHNFTQRSYGEIDIISADMISEMIKDSKQ